MHIIPARNVNSAFQHGLSYLIREGQRQKSRVGDVIVSPCPVVTAYQFSIQRVLFHEKRDANPFFHLFESLWMLAGRNDAKWLDRFVGDFSLRFAEDDGRQHGAYGFRWMRHFDLDGGGEDARLPNQLDTIVDLLKSNPEDRRIVLTMWDPVADLGMSKRDVPCNTHAYFRIRKVMVQAHWNSTTADPEYESFLDITVCCRSNDAVWGAYGANAVHFSVLQEYVAARVGVKIGTYYQLSNNFHVYTDILPKLGDLNRHSQDLYMIYAKPTPIVTVADQFDSDLRMFMSGMRALPGTYANAFFPDVAVPLLDAHSLWKKRKREDALEVVKSLPVHCDWRIAAELWMTRRMFPSKQQEPSNVGE